MDGRKARRPAAGWKRHLVVIGVYALLALLLTYPLGLRFLSHVPGDGGDDPALAWNLWWVPYALLQLRANPFACDYMFYPIGINLAFYTLTIFNAFLSTPLQAIMALVPVSNVVLLSSFVLSGYGAFLLAGYLLADVGERSGWAAFVAGFVYAFSSNKLFYAALGQFNIASSQWIPFYVLFLLKLRREPGRWRYGLLAGLFMLFQGLAELTYASFLAVFTVVYLAWHAATAWRSVGNRAFVRGLVLAAAVALIGLSPTLAMMIPDLRAEGDFSVQGSGFAETFSADVLGFFVPTMHHPLLGSLVERFSFPHEKGQHLYPGYAVLGLALYAVFRRRRERAVRFWAVSAGVFFLLCLGPSLRVNGVELAIPLPFRVLQQLPLFKANRYPSRFSVLLTLSLAMLVAYSLSLLLDHLRTHSKRATGYWLLVTGCWLLVAFEHLSFPLPLSDFRVPDVYRTIAAQPGDFTVLDLPLAWRNGFRVTGPLDPIFMFEQWYQTTHHKRLLSGNTSRNPEFKFQYFTEAPVINSLLTLELGHPLDEGVAERDRAIAPEVLRFFDVRYAVVHTAHVGPGLVPYIEATFPVTRVYDGEGIVAYRVEWPEPPPAQTVDLGGELGRLHTAEGWAVPTGEWVWAQRLRTRLLVSLAAGEQRMVARILSPGEGQSVTLSVNGRRLAPAALETGWHEVEWRLPAGYVRPGLNEVWFEFARLFPVTAVAGGDRAVGQTGVASPVDVTVVSAGMDVGELGHIYVAGRDVSPGGVGYNLAVIQPATGEVEAVASFDTFASEGESQRLARWVAGIPAGRIVAVAVRDEASRYLTGEAVAALRTLGLAGDLRGRWRWSHAAIGVKGASPGQAVEMVSGTRPAVAVVGAGATEPGLAAAFDWVRLDPVGEPR